MCFWIEFSRDACLMALERMKILQAAEGAAGPGRSGKPWLNARVWIGVFGILACALIGASAGAQTDAKNVLVIFGALQGEPVLALIESSVRTRVPDVNFYVEYLDYQRLEEESYRESLAETIRRGHREVRPDIVVVASIHSLEFVIEYGDKMFPGVPVVFTEVSAGELQGQKIPAGMTGLMVSLGLRETIDLALHLHPDTKTVAIVAATPGPPEKYWVDRTHAELLRHRDVVNEIDIIGPPSRQMLERVVSLPPHTIVLFELAPQSAGDPAVGAFDILKAVAQYRPTYSPLHTLCLKYGCIGGAYSDWRQQALRTGEIAARLLAGEKPEAIPIVEDSAFQVQVDWRELRRWHIPESELPVGSMILFRSPSIWESYWKYILAAIIVIFALLLLVIALLWQRARNRKAEVALRESEQRFRVMADATPALVWMCDAQGKVIYLNERRVIFTGPNRQAGYGDRWAAYVHPEDLPRVFETISLALKTRQPFSKEYRLRRRDGVYRCMFDVASPRVNGDGSFAGFIGSAIDVTDQRLAQRALERVSGQMIDAQEKERTRIARDLHDDICQRLALLSMEIEQAKRVSRQSPETTGEALQEIRTHCSEIASDVQSLSHQLHSSRLDLLGIVVAIRGFCKEFSKKHAVNVEFRDKHVPAKPPNDVSLCLFRIAQEALHNAVKYSGTTEFTVELYRIEDEIRLVVTDQGAGFDALQAQRKGGLGLLSMQERIQLVHGKLEIESAPGMGTKVIATVPGIVSGQFPAKQGAVQDSRVLTGSDEAKKHLIT
jgi:PAS domain S-box-containing protein